MDTIYIPRELKIKAWSPSKKIWRSDWSISSYEEVLDLNEERQDADLILVRYIGLKDIENTEIYEEDIVEGLEYPSGIFVIKFGMHETSTDYYSAPAYGFYLENVIKNLEQTFSADYVEKCKKIGTTFEDPGLLD